jgi:hypothetical protein
LQAEVASVFKHQCLPELERLFDRLCPPGMTLSLDRLELDLGELDPARLEEQFSEALLKALEEALRSPGEGGKATGLGEKNGAVISENQYVAEVSHQIRRWLSFLELGWLPGWNGLPDALRWEGELLEALRAEPALRPQLGLLLARSRAARQRLLRQHSPSFLSALEEMAGLPAWLQDLASRLDQAFPQALSAERLRERLAAALFSVSAPGPAAWAAALRDWLEEQPLARPEALRLLAALPGPERLLPGVIDFQKDILQSLVPDPLREAVCPEAAPAEPPGEALYVSHAGLVLLYPFLAPFFRELGLLAADEDQFGSEDARERAVHLLIWLATGEEDAPEQEAPVAKLLCGMPLGFPLQRAFALSEGERFEGLSLLEALIGHWSALKSTRPEGLREAFLRRPGKLEWREGAWRLQVETSTLDVLLARLPWGLSLVKLPWMRELIHIHWT